MDHDRDQSIRELAYSIWLSADRPYWVALDYWLMAEKMVIELMIAANGGIAGIHPSTKIVNAESDRSDANRRARDRAPLDLSA